MVILLTQLPRRVRARLWLAYRRDVVAIWFADREHYLLAEWVWRLTGGWN